MRENGIEENEVEKIIIIRDSLKLWSLWIISFVVGFFAKEVPKLYACQHKHLNVNGLYLSYWNFAHVLSNIVILSPANQPYKHQ